MERWPARQIASVSGCCCCWWCWCFTTHKVHRTAICTWCLVLASARLPLMLLLLPHTFICLMARAWTLWRRERERVHESELQVGFGVAWAVCQVVQKQQLLYSVSLCSSRCSSRPSEFTWLGSHQNKRTNRQTESTVAQAAVHASADGAARARCHCHQARRQRRGEALNASVCEGVHR